MFFLLNFLEVEPGYCLKIGKFGCKNGFLTVLTFFERFFMIWNYELEFFC